MKRSLLFGALLVASAWVFGCGAGGDDTPPPNPGSPGAGGGAFVGGAAGSAGAVCQPGGAGQGGAAGCAASGAAGQAGSAGQTAGTGGTAGTGASGTSGAAGGLKRRTACPGLPVVSESPRFSRCVRAGEPGRWCPVAVTGRRRAGRGPRGRPTVRRGMDIGGPRHLAWATSRRGRRGVAGAHHGAPRPTRPPPPWARRPWPRRAPPPPDLLAGKQIRGSKRGSSSAWVGGWRGEPASVARGGPP
jgi:hypothetical protein